MVIYFDGLDVIYGNLWKSILKTWVCAIKCVTTIVRASIVIYDSHDYMPSKCFSNNVAYNVKCTCVFN